ncbi:MAG: ABC transporter substrate-binding protein, partial [Roseiarcus sp.]
MSELDYLAGKLRLGAISRREFMGRAAALGVSTALISTMVGNLGAVAAETPKKGGSLRLGLAGGSTTDSIDPGSYTDSVMIAVGHGLFNALVEWSADGKPAPELATSWEAKNGATEWIFNLRKGVKFSDGRNFDADDAVYSLNLHRGETKSGAAGVMKAVKDVKKLDRYQIQFTLDAADADFPYVLTDYHLLMVPDGFKDWSKPVGTGGYILDHFDPGVRIAVKRSGDYWKEGRGNLDAAEITVIGDGSARLNALVSHQIDIINRVDHKAVALLSKTPKTEIVRAPGGWHTVMAMEMDKPPYDNPDIR